MTAKKILAFMLIMVLLILSVAGCGHEDNETSAAEELSSAAETTGMTEAGGSTEASREIIGYSPEPVTITFCYSGKELEEFFSQKVAEFNEMSDETLITVEPVCVETYGEIRDLITPTSIEEDPSYPGVVLFDLHEAVQYYGYGAFVDVAEMLTKNGYIPSDILDGVMDQVTVDGAMVGVPWSAETAVYYYNRTALEKHDLDDFPETWEELKAWSKAVYEATGLPAITFADSGEAVIYDLVRNFGGTLVEEGEPLKSGWDEDDVIARLKELGELVEAGYVAWTKESLNREAWRNGEVICFSGSTADYMKYLEELELLPEEKRFELGLAWNVEDRSALATVGGSVLAVPDGNRNRVKEAAGVFITWLSAPENQADYAGYSGGLMVHKSNIEASDVMKTVCEATPELTGIYEKLLESGVAAEQNMYRRILVEKLGDTLSGIYLDGKDFDQAYAELIDDAENTLAGN